MLRARIFRYLLSKNALLPLLSTILKICLVTYLTPITLIITSLILHSYTLPKETYMKYGSVKWFDPKKGYGFITPDDSDKDVFIHITQVLKFNRRSLQQGQRLAFDTYSDRGRVAASISAFL